jgi:3-methyl-2-oxobutanoate hydroxymethyltransferase
MARKKISINDLYQKKTKGEKVSWLTCYDFPTAQFQETAGIEMILVGDSMGMCVYGYPGTVPVTMDQCVGHSEAVRRGAPTAFVIGDMPFMSYQPSDEVAVANAGRFLKEAIVDAGIVVCGHIGLAPQSSGQLGGHKAQGRTAESAEMLIKDALAVQEAGAQLLLLEAVPPELSSFITKKLTIPVYGIGAGLETDGQLLIISDLVGQFQAFTPKFVKKYRSVLKNASTALGLDFVRQAWQTTRKCHLTAGPRPGTQPRACVGGRGPCRPTAWR